MLYIVVKTSERWKDYLFNVHIMIFQDVITVQFTFTMEDHIQTTNGSQHYASVGLLFNDLRLWVGQYLFTAIRDDLTMSGYSDVSVNIGPYCPRVFYFKDDVIEQAERVSDIIDDIIGVHDKKEKARINRLLDEIVGAHDRNTSTTPKPLITTHKQSSANKIKPGKLGNVKKPDRGKLYVHKLMKAGGKSADLAMNTIVKTGEYYGIRTKQTRNPAYRNALLDGRIPNEYTHTSTATSTLYLYSHFYLLCLLLPMFFLF